MAEFAVGLGDTDCSDCFDVSSDARNQVLQKLKLNHCKIRTPVLFIVLLVRESLFAFLAECSGPLNPNATGDPSLCWLEGGSGRV